MVLYDISREELQGMLAQLEQAIFQHQLWHAAVIRALLCKLPCDQHDISPEAHHECRFGQWYYGKIPAQLRDLPGFITLGNEHKHVHQLAAKILIEAKAGNTVVAFDYDNSPMRLTGCALRFPPWKVNWRTYCTTTIR
jgi:diguanylate cyclase